MNSIKVLYINNRNHDDPHESPKKELEGSEEVQNTLFLHITGTSLNSEWFDKLHYIYQHFQECKKQFQADPNDNTILVEDPLYPHINNDIEYGLFEDVVDSYYLVRSRMLFNAIKSVTHKKAKLMAITHP